MTDPHEEIDPDAIAIVGMAGRFPGADDIGRFWANLREGVESIRRVPESELDALGVDEQTRRDPNFVPYTAFLDDPDCFDADFFGVQPREAAHTDPQHRVFLETAWHALEDAGYDPAGADRAEAGTVGVYAGATLNSYLLFHLLPGRDTGPSVFEGLHLGTLNAGDFLTSRVAYKLGLSGPTQTVQTACSSSLVAVHNAAQALLLGDCDTALAGGVSVQVHHRGGYRYTPDSAASPDGHCRVFDERGEGTVFGSGCAVVVLRRLGDALAGGDRIRAVLLGSAVNNDGPDRAGFTAPGVTGQSRVVAQALANAGVSAESIGYVEAHGTATRLGDPIEVRALTRAFRAHTDRRNYCALGSVKANVGHLDAAAGVAGLIKAVHVLETGLIPPVPHFRRANPELGLPDSPFFVNPEPLSWPDTGHPRRAGVSSFGIGGANAHLVLQQAPPQPPPAPAAGWQVVLASTRTAPALGRLTDALRTHLENDPVSGTQFADLAFTAQTGRRSLDHRRWVIGRDAAEAAHALATQNPLRTGVARTRSAEVALVFPGMGPHHTGMGAGLYRDEPVFAEHVNRCADLLHPLLGADLREHLFGGADGSWTDLPRLSLPATFAVDYALAQLLIDAGVRPSVVLGHSVGEYVAACLAGVFELPDALRLVAARGEIFSGLSGEMLTVSLSEPELSPLLGAELSLAAVNAERSCVVSGPAAAIRELTVELDRRGTACRPLPFPAAAHSALVEPELPRFRTLLEQVRFAEPSLPLVSNLTGTWAGSEMACPDYWVRHLRGTVRFADGLRTAGEAASVFVETGPGQTMSRLARLNLSTVDSAVLPVMRHRDDERTDGECLAAAFGALWACGVDVDWRTRHTTRRRAAFPLYPFERQRHWIEPPAPTATPEPSPVTPEDPGGAAPVAHFDDRVTEVADRIATVMARVSGLPSERIDRGTNLFQLGFDSVALVEAGMAINEIYGTTIPVREMFEQLSTVDALAAHVAAILPTAPPIPVAGAAMTEPTPEVTESTTSTATTSSAAGVVAQQIEVLRRQTELQHELFTRQLAVLGGTAAEAAPASTEPPPAPSPPPFSSMAALTVRPPSLTAGQREYLADFTRRYTTRTAGSRDHTARSRLVRANFRNRENLRADLKDLVYPIFAERGRGGRIQDVDGNDYVDLTMGFGSVLLGHHPDFIEQAVQAELRDGQGMLVGPCSAHAEQVAELIAELTGVERVAFFTSGTHAVMVALRLARAATGRRRVVVFSGSFHGTYDATLVRRDLTGDREGTLPVGPGLPEGVTADVLMVDYAKPAALDTIRVHAHELAAVLVEPVQSRMPGLDVGPFLTELREITAASGTALVFDEMVTGFRLHPGGAQAVFGVRADLVTYGKIAGGGMPLGVVAGSAHYLDGVDGGQWSYGDDSMPPNDERRTITGGTFCEHPLAMVAAKAVLTHLVEAGPELQRELSSRSDRFAARLRAAAAEHDAPVTVANFGSIVRIGVPSELELLYYELIHRGVYLWEGRTLFVSTAHTDDDLDQVVEALRASLTTLRAHGFLGPVPQPAVPQALALTDEQQQMWARAGFDRDSAVVFHDSAVVSLSGELDPDDLRAAVADVVARHDALRTSVSEKDGRPVQTVHPDATLEVPLLDWTDRRAPELERWLEEQVRRPFDWDRPPLMRVTLLRLAPAEHRLVVLVHHLVVDGWSWNVVLQDLFAAYLRRRGVRTGIDSGAAPALADFLDWRAERIDGPSGEAALAHWHRVLAAPPPPLNLPAGRITPARRVHAAGRHQEYLDAELYQRLTDVARAHRVTLPMILFGVFTVLLHRLTGRTDLLFALPTAGQLAMGNPELVGCCDNVLPVRVGVDPDTEFTAHLTTVRGLFGEVYEHQAVSFAGLVSLADRTDCPLPAGPGTVLFNVDKPVSIPSVGGLTLSVRPGPLLTARGELGLNAVDVGGQLRLDFDYDADLLDPAHCRSWFESYTAMVRTVAEHPETRLGGLAGADPVFGQVPAAVPSGSSYTHGPAERVVATFPEGRLTVGELTGTAVPPPDGAAARLPLIHDMTEMLRTDRVPAWWPGQATPAGLLAHGRAAAEALGLRPGAVLAMLPADQAHLTERLLGAVTGGYQVHVLNSAEDCSPEELAARLTALGVTRVELPLGASPSLLGALPALELLVLSGHPDTLDHGGSVPDTVGRVMRAYRAPDCGLTLALAAPATPAEMPGIVVEPVTTLRIVGAAPGVPGPVQVLSGDAWNPAGIRGLYLPDGRLAFRGPELLVRNRTVWLPALVKTLRSVPGVTDVELATPAVGRLELFVLPGRGAEPDETVRRCREAVTVGLPDGYLPHRITAVSVLHRTWSGRFVPPAPAEPARTNGTGTATATALERVLAIWAELTDQPDVEAEDNLFDLGGTSLTAARLVSRLDQEFGRRLSLREVFTAPTPAGLTELLDGTDAGERSTEPGPQPLPRDTTSFELSFAQRRLWYVEQLGGGASYVVFFGARLHGELDVDALREALNRVVDRHEILRTRFVELDDEPVQKILPTGTPAHLQVGLTDLTGLAEPEREHRIGEVAARQQDTPFDLTADTPLLRAELLALGPREHVLLIAAHHIICDGWSFDVLLRDTAAWYGALTGPAELVKPLPELAVQYVDYAAWQRRWLAGPGRQEQLAYWRETLGLPPVQFELEPDRPRPPVQTFAGAVHRLDLPTDVVRGLRALAGAEGTSLFVVLLAGFQTLLHAVTGASQVVVATPSANRRDWNTEQLIGFFVNMLVIRTGFTGEPTFRELVGRVADSVLAADANREVPFELVVDDLLAEREPSRPPLATVMFLMDTVAEDLRAGELRLERLHVDWKTAKYDLSLLVDNVGDRCHCVFEYNSDLFTSDTVRLLASRLDTLLSRLAADPGVRL